MNVLVYANVNLNLIDGSTIWVQSLAEVLGGELGCKVIVLSREQLEDRGVVPALRGMACVRLLSCADHGAVAQFQSRPGDPAGIEQIVRHLDEDERLDRIVIRDSETALRLARVDRLRSRLWAYVLESPSFAVEADRSALQELADKAAGLLVQTDTQRGLLESIFPSACNKVDVLPPMVQPVSVDPAERRSPAAQVEFVYSGKYSRDWNVEAFFDVPGACQAAGIAATVTLIGDKVHNEKSDPEFRQRILGKFTATPGVTWLGPMGRNAAIGESARHHLGLCWRTGALDDSLEISTKFLEFASVGVPSVVNRTAAYEALLGADYPYFASEMGGVVAAARSVVADPELHERMRERCIRLARDFSFARAGERLRAALRLGRNVPTGAEPPPTVLIATHDPKFIRAALDRLSEDGRYRIVHDRWRSTTTHDPAQSEALLRQADIIFCEWCVGQAAWYSSRKLPHQKLYIRLHRFEAFRGFPAEVAAGAVDGFIVVSEHFRDICVRDFGWPEDRIVVLPQYCLAEQLAREKHPSARHTLGFVGINGYHHKRFDRAVDVLRLVRREAPEMRMRVRSAMPWEFDWVWKDNPEERRKFEVLFESIERDEDLGRAIIFDRPGPNMAEWYRGIGYILSTSESEGCHTSVAEGICSGAVPVVIDWPGARSIYGSDVVHGSVEEMAAALLRAYRDNAPTLERQAQGARDFDIARTLALLEQWFSPGLKTARAA